jgi:hypothetical protein
MRTRSRESFGSTENTESTEENRKSKAWFLTPYPVKKVFQDFVRAFRAFRGQITLLSGFVRG